MTEEAVVTTPVTETVTPAAPENTAPVEEVKAVETPEAEPEKKEEEKHRSRQARRFDRARERAIAAETELRLLKERITPKPAQREAEEGEPKRDQYGTYEEFIEARAEWRGGKAAERALMKAIERDQEDRSKETQAKQAKEWSGRIDSARNEIDDFDDVCAESEAPVTSHMSGAIMESDRGPHIAYYLAKNPEEAERISKLSPSRQVAAIVNLEEKVAKPVKTPSKAPAPINPVGRTSGPDNDSPSDKDDTTTWIRKEKARMEKLGIR